MKTLLETEDIQAIASAVIVAIRPLVSGGGKQPGNDELFDVKGVCDYLKVSKQWIYERTHLYEIPFYKMDGHLRFKKSELDKWLLKYRRAGTTV